MNKLLLSGSALLAALSVASSAQAADLAAAPAYDWTGFYLGANAGVAWNQSTVEDRAFYLNTGAPASPLDNTLDSSQAVFTAGGLLGYNYQIDRIVLGAETDFNYVGFNEDNTDHLLFENLEYTTKTSFEADWFGTIRGRLGFAFDNVLVYGTGGAAYGRMNAKGSITNSNGDSWKGSADATNWGWTVGGGAEYGVDNWSLGLEYLYVDLGNGDYSATARNGILKGSADYAFSTVRATVKYRFQ